MNGVENITENIRKESVKKSDAIISQAHVKKKEIINSLISNANVKSESDIYEAQKCAFELVNRAKSMAGLENRKKLLAAKREIMSEVFDRIEISFTTMEIQGYVKFLACMAISVGEGTLTFSEHDKQYAQSVYSMIDSKKFKLDIEYTNSINSGFIVTNGAIETNCSVQAVIDEKRRELEPEIAKILFDGNNK